MKPSVYVETSIFSALVARPTTNLLATARQQTTRIWWQNDADDFDLCSSDTVRFEAAAGDAEMARQRLEYIDSLPRLSATRQSDDLADSLLVAGILPVKARTDAEHICIATLHKIQFLVTWNCRHLANGRIREKVVRHLREFGYNATSICTPSELPKVNDDRG